MIGSVHARYRVLIVVFCLLSPCFSFAEEQPLPEPGPDVEQRAMSGNDRREQYLVQQRPEQVRWLGEGESRFAIMETPAQRAETHGTVLVVADAGQSAAQGFAGQLHQMLPSRGWRVVSFALPPLPLPVYSDRSSLSPGFGAAGGAAVRSAGDPDSADAGASEAGGSNAQGRNARDRNESTAGSVTIDLAASAAGSDALQQFESQASTRLTSTLEMLAQEQPGAVVMVGIGLGAAPLTQQLADGSLGAYPPAGQRAMVWVQPRFQHPVTGNEPIPGGLSDLASWPVLDIIQRNESGSAESERRTAMQKLDGSAAYRQDAFMLSESASRAMLAYRIHNWALRQLK